MKDKNDIGTRLTELQVERERLMGELENARIEARDALISGQETRGNSRCSGRAYCHCRRCNL